MGLSRSPKSKSADACSEALRFFGLVATRTCCLVSMFSVLRPSGPREGERETCVSRVQFEAPVVI